MKGLLKKGSTSNAYVKRGVGSVPSKFETILYPPTLQGSASLKGFGSNVGRFGPACTSQDGSDEPGPGQYLEKQNLHKMNLQSDSFSRKGFGNGFISKVSRFPDRSFENFW